MIENPSNRAEKAWAYPIPADSPFDSSPRRSRRSITLAIIALLFLFGTYAGQFLIIDKPQTSDVIVVLAGGTDLRIEHGIHLLDQHYGRRLLVDVSAADKVYGFSEVQLAQKYIESLPEANSIQVCPIEGLSTKDESRDVERCLSSSEHRVLIVTSEFHTRRALDIFRHEIPGITFSTGAAFDTTQFGPHWWEHRQWAKTCLDEWLRVIWWNLIDRWR